MSTLLLLVLSQVVNGPGIEAVMQPLFFQAAGNAQYVLAFDPAGAGEIREQHLQVLLAERDGRRIRIQNEDLTMAVVGQQAPLDSPPLALVSLVVDNSGSIDDTGLASVEEALVQFLQALPPDVAVQLIRFSEVIQTKSTFSRDRAMLVRLARQREKQGGTALHDAVDVALNELQYAPFDAPLKFLVLITDGADNTHGRFADPKTFEKHVLERTRAQRINLCTLGVTKDVDQRLLGAVSNGGYHAVPDFDALTDVLSQISAGIARVRVIRMPALSDPTRLVSVQLVQPDENGVDQIIREITFP